MCLRGRGAGRAERQGEPAAATRNDKGSTSAVKLNTRRELVQLSNIGGDPQLGVSGPRLRDRRPDGESTPAITRVRKPRRVTGSSIGEDGGSGVLDRLHISSARVPPTCARPSGL
jgi:hypothetical protein